MDFITDRMLGRLTRWLRLLGYDTVIIRESDPRDDDDSLLATARDEGRILLTRDRNLIRRALKSGIGAYLVQSSNINEQLTDVCTRFELEINVKMDRCTLCNSPIRQAGPGENIERDYLHPDTVGTAQLWICDACGQVYWEGAHWPNIMRKVERIRREVGH